MRTKKISFKRVNSFLALYKIKRGDAFQPMCEERIYIKGWQLLSENFGRIAECYPIDGGIRKVFHISVYVTPRPDLVIIQEKKGR